MYRNGKTISKIKKIITIQSNKNDCGIAALQTIIRWHGGEIDHEDIRIASGTQTFGTTLLGLYQAAMEFGFSAEGVELDKDFLFKQTDPCILHVVNPQNLLHYIVYFGMDKETKKLLIFDPTKGLEFLCESELDRIWKRKVALLLKPNDAFAKSKPRNDAKIQWLLIQIRKDQTLIISTIVLGAAISLLGLSTAIYSQKLVDDYLPKKDVFSVILGIGLLGLILGIRAILSYLRQIFIFTQSKKLNIRVISSFFYELLKLPKRFFDSRSTGDMIARLNDSQRIQQAITFIFGNAVIDILTITASLFLLCYYNWQIGLLAFTFVTLILIIFYKNRQRLQNNQREVMANYGITEANYIDTIQGIATIKQNAAIQLFHNVSKFTYERYQEKLFILNKVGSKLYFIVDVVTVSLTLTVLAMVSSLVLNGLISIGEVMAIISTIGMLVPATNRLSQMLIQVQEARTAFNRIYDLTRREHLIPIETTSDKSLHEFLSLTFKNVSFRFNGQKKLIHNLSFSINKGDTICIKGPSGAGKSTVFQLILRYYKPNGGEIYLNNISYESLNEDMINKYISIVPQEIKIFNGSVLFNITLQQNISHSELNKFNEKYEINRFAKVFPFGYETVLGENGINLSGGQKQLLGFLRALYKNPSLLLLDEATSAMDLHMEKMIFDLLSDIHESIAVIWVNHKEDLPVLFKRNILIIDHQD